jgi:hypothetical protein
VLWQVDRVSAQDQAVAPGGAEVLRLVVSPNAQFVALFTSDGQLVVMSAGGWAGGQAAGLVWRATTCCTHLAATPQPSCPPTHPLPPLRRPVPPHQRV